MSADSGSHPFDYILLLPSHATLEHARLDKTFSMLWPEGQLSHHRSAYISMLTATMLLAAHSAQLLAELTGKFKAEPSQAEDLCLAAGCGDGTLSMSVLASYLHMQS